MRRCTVRNTCRPTITGVVNGVKWRWTVGHSYFMCQWKSCFTIKHKKCKKNPCLLCWLDLVLAPRNYVISNVAKLAVISVPIIWLNPIWGKARTKLKFSRLLATLSYTRSFFVELESCQIYFRHGLHPGPRWGAHDTSPDPIIGWTGEYILTPLDAWVSFSVPAAPRPLCRWKNFWAVMKAGVRTVLKFLKLQSCPEIVVKFEIVLKSQSFSTNVLILTIVVRAQWQFNVLLASLLIRLLYMWIQFWL